MKPLNVLSLFNGISCARIALDRAGIPVANYYESEIDKYAGKVSAYNWPESVQIGDVRNVVVKDLPFIPDLLAAGSPCQGFSFAGKQLNFNDPRSALFFEFVRILKECREVNPNVLFLLENVPMKKEFQRVINEALGVYPVTINGALVSAQNRERLFWTNIRTKQVGVFGETYSDIPQPKDKGIILPDILESDVDEKYMLSEAALARIEKCPFSKPQFEPDKTGTILCKNNSGQLSVNKGTTLIGVVNDNGTLRQVEQSGCIDSNYAKGMDNHGQRTLAMIVQRGRGQNKGGIKAEDGKTPTVSANRWEQNNHLLWGKQPRQQDRVNVGEKSRCVPASSNGSASHFTKTLVGSKIRRLTPTEVCRLFNVPDRYFHDKDSNLLVSESQQYKALGNGWVVDVIAHIFSFIPDKISQNG